VVFRSVARPPTDQGIFARRLSASGNQFSNITNALNWHARITIHQMKSVIIENLELGAMPLSVM
jgi:hypothetical protein